MEALEESLFLERIPSKWEKYAYPSLLPLSAWFTDLLRRLQELESWVAEFQVSFCVKTLKIKSLKTL